MGVCVFVGKRLDVRLDGCSSSAWCWVFVSPLRVDSLFKEGVVAVQDGEGVGVHSDLGAQQA